MLTLLVCTAALGGLVAGQLARLATAQLVASAVLGAASAATSWRYPRWRLGGLAITACALGALRAATVPSAPSAEPSQSLGAHVGHPVTVQGVVETLPSVTDRAARAVVGISTIEDAASQPAHTSEAYATPVSAQQQQPAYTSEASLTAVSAQPQQPALNAIAVVAAPDSALAGAAPGDRLEASGTLRPGAGRGPPTLLFPAQLHIETGPRDLATQIQVRARQLIAAGLPPPQAALAADVLLGGSSGIDPSLRLELERSGLAHLLAIDGFKQVLLAGALRTLAVPLFGRGRAPLLVLPLVLAYTLITGAHASAVRAALMVGLAELATLSRRMPDPLTSLLLAATIMAALQPTVLLDFGFQLSVSATLGLILLWPRLRYAVRRLPRFLAEPAGLTLAVSLATLPVVLSTFQLLPLVSPLAHIVAVPLLAPVLLSTALLAIVGWLLPSAVPVLGLVVWLPTTLLLQTVRLFGDLPGGAIATGHLALPGAVALAALLLVWGIWQLPDVSHIRLRLARHPLRAPLATAGASALALSLVLLVRPDGQLHIDVLERQPGEAVLVRGPNGQTALVVSGNVDGFALESALGAALPVWEHGVDYVILEDAAAQPAVDLLLRRYSARRELTAADAATLDLGGGVSIDARDASLRFDSSGEARPLL